jgi:hypothetical protein
MNGLYDGSKMTWPEIYSQQPATLLTMLLDRLDRACIHKLHQNPSRLPHVDDDKMAHEMIDSCIK